MTPILPKTSYESHQYFDMDSELNFLICEKYIHLLAKP